MLYDLVRSKMDFEKVQFFDREQFNWVHVGGLVDYCMRVKRATS